MNHAQVACITVPANNLVNFSSNFQPVIKHTVKFKKLRISIIPFFPVFFREIQSNGILALHPDDFKGLINLQKM